MSVFAFILLYGVSYGLVLCLIALGLVITMGLMRVVNLAHGAFAMIGGYLASYAARDLGLGYAAGVLIAIHSGLHLAQGRRQRRRDGGLRRELMA